MWMNATAAHVRTVRRAASQVLYIMSARHSFWCPTFPLMRTGVPVRRDLQMVAANMILSASIRLSVRFPKVLNMRLEVAIVTSM